MNKEEKIRDQREKVLNDQSKVVLFAPCKIDEGILRLTSEEWERAISTYKNSNAAPTFFIPASGSGSRMFSFLFEFLDKPDNSTLGSVERFMNHIQEFAFYELLSNEMKHKIQNGGMDAEELAHYLLHESGLNFGNLPKGLIPFHYNEPFVLNPIQEHVLQGTRLSNGRANFHFTIQPEFESKIRNSISNLEGLTGKNYNISYSYQSKETDSIAFLNSGEPAIDSESKQTIMRPAGHGALLDNLNEIDQELILIKNIDNVQHFNSSKASIDTWSALSGLLQNFKEDLRQLALQPSIQKLHEINQYYQFLSPSEINNAKAPHDILALINRPIRVCAMVRNEGQPGGGPFWIEDDGKISKQIVEKAQISLHGEQFRLMVKSTHFNPVIIALSTKDLQGKKIDLNDYRDNSKYFIVHKTQKGQEIKYMELPGLWNGGMAYWNTLFVEVSQDTFSPVKTVLNLLESSHKM